MAAPALDAFLAHLDAHEGQVDAANTHLGAAALREYLERGAPEGRGLRAVTARLRPKDEAAAALAYLFILTVDAATHQGRNAPMAAYAASGKALSDLAGELHALLEGPPFNGQVRPVVGGHKGCAT